MIRTISESLQNVMRGWWCYPIPSEGWGCGGTPRRPNSRAMPKGLDQSSKMEEVVPKVARRRVSDAGQSNVVTLDEIAVETGGR